jgi:hypothetical protein
MAQMLTVAEAVGNFSEIVNKVYYQQPSYLLTQDGVIVAKLTPPDKSLTGTELAARWPKQLPFNPEDADGWEEELAHAKATLPLPSASAWDAPLKNSEKE